MIYEVTKEEMEFRRQFMVDGAPAFSGSLYREGWINQVVYAVRTKEYATVWIFGNNGKEYRLWATSTDGSLELDEIVDTKEKADSAHKGFLNAMKNEKGLMAATKYIRRNDELKEVS